MPVLITYLASTALKFLLTFPGHQAPHTLQVRIQVPDTTRSVAIALQNESYGRESAFQIQDSRTVHWVEWRGVPGGVYQVVGQATLDGGKVIQSSPVNVVVCCGGQDE